MKYNQGRPFLLEEEAKGKVLLVGTAYDGIPRQGFKLKKGQLPEEVLGDCELAHAYTTCLRGGLTEEDVFLYRLNGVRGSMVLTDLNTNRQLLEIFSIGASDLDETIQVMVSEAGLFIEKETTTGVESRSFLFSDYRTSKELVAGIQRAADFSLIEVDARLLHNQSLSTSLFSYQSYPFFQADGQEVHVRTEETDEAVFSQWYEEQLEKELIDEMNEVGEIYSVPAECVVFVDIHPEERPTVLGKIGRFCALKTDETKLFTLGVLNTNQIPGKQEEEEFIDVDEEGNLIDAEGLPYVFDPYEERDAQFERLDALALFPKEEGYQNIHVVIGNHDAGERFIGVHSAYAAMYVQNFFHKSATNKELQGIGELLYDLQKKELVRLESNGYTCIVPSVRRRAIAKKSQHFYTYESSRYEVQPHLLRLSYEISRVVIGEMERYIGEPNTTDIKVSEANLRTILDAYIENSIIRGYDIALERTEIEKIELTLNLSVFGSVEKVSLQHEVKYQQQEVFRCMDV